MNYKSELQRLQRLLQVDHNAYLNELDKPWSSMDEDLDLAIKILLKHASNSGGRLPLLEACYFPDDPSTTLALRRRVEKFDGGSAGNGKESLAERTAWRRWHGGFQAARAVAAARWGPAFSPRPAAFRRRCCR
jgi:hypothetical protein